MIIYSKLEINRIKDFWELLNRLDTETDYMMYEPNERKAKTTIQELKLDIQDNVIQGFDFLQVATENDKIVGYIRAERGKFERNFHTAYIVIGILKKYRGKGIGTTFFNNLDLWAINVNIKMYIFDHLRMYIFAILTLDRYIFLSDKIFL